jgi:hypothetical protein
VVVITVVVLVQPTIPIKANNIKQNIDFIYLIIIFVHDSKSSLLIAKKEFHFFS